MTLSYILSEYLKTIINTECLQRFPAWITTAARQNMIMKTYKELLGTCIKAKKLHIYIQYVPNQLVKIFRTVSLYLALQHVFPEMYSSSILSHKCPRTFFINSDSLYARLNSHYQAWSYMKKKHKKIKAYRKSLYKEPTVNRCLLILDLKPFRS